MASADLGADDVAGDGTDHGDPGQRPRRRLVPARVAPEALARARGDAREGLDWLGRPPEVRASILYLVIRVVARAILLGL
ncbi:MAG: hypothetical protein E6I94_04685, partial [Chloroflexi bacterium]